MKIKSISRTNPELYLITYHRPWLLRWLGCIERYVIHEVSTIKQESRHYETVDFFHYRDTGDYVGNEYNVLKWMIRNDVEFFDNTATRQLYCMPVTKDMLDDAGNLQAGDPDEFLKRESERV